MELLGSAVDANGPQIFLLTDAARAMRWRGGTNGDGDLALGSDWARAFEAFYGAPPSEDMPDGGGPGHGARVIEADGAGIDLVDFQLAGWSLLYRVEDRLVLVDGVFEDEEEVASVAGEDENVPTDPSFRDWVCAPPSDAAKQGGVVELPSGWLVAMSSTEAWAELNGDMPPTLDQIRELEESVFQLDDATGGHALFVRTTTPRYRIFVEAEVETTWGAGARVVLVPA
jgi:hypothetical protein